MRASETLTVRLNAEVKDALSRLADSTRRTKSYLAAEAIEAYVARELAIVEGIEAGLKDMREGRLIDHEIAMAQLDETIAAVERQKS